MIVQTIKWRWMRIICALALMVLIVAPFPFMETIGFAFSEVWRASPQLMLLSPQEARPLPAQRNYVQRIKLAAGTTHELISGEPIVSANIIDPEVATIVVGSDRVHITGLMLGTTILIISGRDKRTTYAIDVERPLVVERAKTDEGRRAEYPESFSGFSSLYFVPGLKGGPSLLRHNFGYSQKLTNDRTLRMSGEMFQFFGGGDRALTLPLGPRFGSNRLTLGLDSPASRIDFLDSELEISRLGLNGYTLRGLHFVSSPDSRWGGLEIFAGNAQPQLRVFNLGEGRLAGAVMPLIQRRALRVRSGMFFIAPVQESAEPASQNMVLGQKGGMVLQTDVRYSPDDRTNAEGEVAYGNGGLSWRGRLYLHRGPITFYGEHSHLNRRSPMIAIGAQSGGRTNSAFNLQWQPNARFNAFLSYDRTRTNGALLDSARIQFNSRTFLVSANFNPTRSARLGITFNQQAIDAPASPLVPFLPNLQTRSAVFKYDQRINSRWANILEARVILSREANTDTQTNRGFSVREQLRYTWRRGSVTGFMNYRGDTPSLEGLILRNPALLPVEFRSAFTADPQRFLLTNRDALQSLLNGVGLPFTRNKESGIRIQSTFSRLEVAGEVIYSIGKFMAIQQRILGTALSANVRLDAANSVQVNASHAFAFSGAPSHTAFTIGYTHRFGAGNGGGFQFSKLLRLGRGRIEGRVFMDLNGNGLEDLGEKGLAGMKVQLDGKKSVTSDSRGDFNFDSLEPGEFDIVLISEELGVTLLASKATLQHISISPHQTINLSFGLTNSSFAAGRVFNDLLLTGEQKAGEAPGLSGVKLMLYPVEGTLPTTPGSKSLIQIADGYGRYEFRNLAPGRYILEIDAATLPENFRLPSQMSWPITISPLQGFYLDLPFVAQRAISGIVYIDKDCDGQFDPRKDVAVEGARVVAGNAAAVSTRHGTYLLRNLPAGKVGIEVFSMTGKQNGPIRLELGHEPTLRTGLNLRIKA
jgi:hypothetical protein